MLVVPHQAYKSRSQRWQLLYKKRVVLWVCRQYTTDIPHVSYPCGKDITTSVPLFYLKKQNIGATVKTPKQSYLSSCSH